MMDGVWNSNHNCYAYAMKCQHPRGLGCNARPGKFAGQAVWTGDFSAGVVNDGLAQNVRIEIVRFGGVPRPVPPRFTDDTYLVALLANHVGYHFLRRNEASGVWFQKRGASNPAQSWFVDFSTLLTHTLTDHVVGNMLEQHAMRFQAYLKVPNQGIQVEG